MTITQDISAPLFVVMGATGLQGRSVVNEIQSDSTVHYRVRAVTRDTTQPTARALADFGCEVVAADSDHLPGLVRAFSGAEVVFGTTAFGPQGAREVQQGKNQVDTAKAAGVKTFVWSSLPSRKRQSNGKYTHVVHAEWKAEVAVYAHALASDDFKVLEVQVGLYISNIYTYAPFSPAKQPDGSYAILHVSDDDLPIPYLDLQADVGAYVVGAVKNIESAPNPVLAAPRYTTLQEQVSALSKVSGGKKVVLKTVTYEEFFNRVKATRGEYHAGIMSDMLFFFAEFGYFSKADLEASNAILSRNVRTFEESVLANRAKFEPLFRDE